MNTVGGSGLWDEEDGFYYDQLKTPGGRQIPLKTRSLVGLLPLIAVEVLETAQIEKMPGFKKRMEWFLNYREDLKPTITFCEPCSHFCHRMLAAPTHDRLVRTLRYMLDENEFLSSYGLRSVSRVHRDKPYVFAEGTRNIAWIMCRAKAPATFSGATPTGAARSGFPSITLSSKHSNATTISMAIS
jgi:hypothetical protein